MYNEVFNQLAETPSRLEKLAILKKFKNDSTMKRILFLALDPFTQFYIRKIPDYTPEDDPWVTLDGAMERLAKLSSRDITGNAAITYLGLLLSELTPNDANVIKRIIAKDLRCGVSDATVNAVFPKLIPSYPCMLASGYDEKLIAKVKFPAYVQLKLDGMRFNAIVRNGSVEFRSRNGKEVDIKSPLLVEAFIKMASAVDYPVVYDGELIVVNAAGKTLDRKTGNGILNKAVKGTQSEAEGALVRAVIWDAISLTDVTQDYCKTPYSDRLKVVSKSLDKLEKSSLNHLVSMVPNYTVNSMNEVHKLFNKALREGEEGVILKSIDAPWENKRSKNLIKFKSELECDLKIVGWEEGTGKNVGILGALVVESSDGKIKTNVGTGFTDEDRKAITPAVIGKIVAVKYNARISDKNSDTDSLFLPVFLEIREDKTKADSSKDIK